MLKLLKLLQRNLLRVVVGGKETKNIYTNCESLEVLRHKPENKISKPGRLFLFYLGLTEFRLFTHFFLALCFCYCYI